MRYQVGSISGVPLWITETFVVSAALVGLFGGRRVAQASWVTHSPPQPDSGDPVAMSQWLEALEGPVTQQPSTGWAIAAGLCIALVFLISILAHELGHFFAARKVGARPAAIRLHFAGGQVEFEDTHRLTAGTFALMVVAGPLVTALLALASFGVLRTFGETESAAQVFFEHVFGAAFVLNAIALAVNLLPIRPLDGGQLLLAARLRLARRG
jgi:Zn-dependent protease